jgi:hypothetical protein
MANTIENKAPKKLVDRASVWLREKAPDFQCPTCKNREFNVAEDLVTPIIMRNKGLVLGGAAYPNAMFICKRCGTTTFVNAIASGLIEGFEPEQQIDDDKGEKAE